MSDPITRVNAALEGRYSIERELGEGGMATVFLADDLKHERKGWPFPPAGFGPRPFPDPWGSHSWYSLGPAARRLPWKWLLPTLA